MKFIFSLLILLSNIQPAFANTQIRECSQQMCFEPDNGRSLYIYCMSVPERFWDRVDQWGPVLEAQNCVCPCKKYFRYSNQANQESES